MKVYAICCFRNINKGSVNRLSHRSCICMPSSTNTLSDATSFRKNHSIQKENMSVTEVIISLIPVIGSGLEAYKHFRKGNTIRGVLWTALLLLDFILAIAFLKMIARMAGITSMKLIAKQSGGVASSTADKIIHMSSSIAEKEVSATGKIGGRWGIFGVAYKAPDSTFRRHAAALTLKDISKDIVITGEAVKAFIKPPVSGLFSGMRRCLGVRSTKLGSIDLKAGKFIEGEVFRKGVFSKATMGDKIRYEIHQFGLDYGIDALLNTTMKAGILNYDLRE